MKGWRELKTLLDVVALDSSVYARVQVSSVVEQKTSRRKRYRIVLYPVLKSIREQLRKYNHKPFGHFISTLNVFHNYNICFSAKPDLLHDLKNHFFLIFFHNFFPRRFVHLVNYAGPTLEFFDG